MFEQSLISFVASPSALDVTEAIIVVDQDDFPGVHHAARDLASDFAKVTNRTLLPQRVVNGIPSSQDSPYPKTAIIVGSINASNILQLLARNKVVEFKEIQGKWESYMTVVVDNPLPGCERALIVAGSDKRGAIFGAYTVSEQIGISPYD